ncbi:MAG: NAD(P)H-dependent glycerol-3-phosphate dehydrogenase [Ruminococcaceae bacterium]|nr:NAD(P)H-dependent glycerol-3-phosphate dehydrogenase [Oscillospiraceae bacterium]
MGNAIAVVGSGSWGTAIAHLLSAERERDVVLWSYKKEESEALMRDRENKEFLPGVMLNDRVSFTWDISCVADKELVVLVSPSHTIRTIARSMKPYVKVGTVVVILSKGIEVDTCKTLSEIVAEEIPQCRVAVMSGPSHAEEVSRGIPTANVAASEDMDAARLVQDTFMCQNFRIYTSTDVLGVEVGGALKNVIALCAGVVDGIGFGDNTKAALMTRGIAEIARLGAKMGAQPQTFYGLSGIGDLIVTCTSMHSRNRRAGILIGQGNSLDDTLRQVHMVVEGVITCKAAHRLAERYNVEMPIVEQAHRVLYEGKNPREAVVELMMRDKKGEIL